MLRAIREVACKEVRIGLESGDPYIRNEIFERNMSNGEFANTFKLSVEVGLNTSAFNMIGISEETPERFKRTIELNHQVKSDKL